MTVETIEPLPRGLGLFARARKALEMFGFWPSSAYFILMAHHRRRFIASGGTGDERAWRRQLCSAFAAIHDNIVCGHSPFQFICVAEHLLNLDVDGPIVECGAFKGGSTAQLSLIAKRTNRKLYVCDSFQGLPAPSLAEEHVVTSFEKSYALQFRPGDYAGTLDEVKQNLARYGCLEVCELVPGLFKDTLPGLAIRPAAVFIDVDLVSSARDCLKYLWPRLQDQGLFFTHEAHFDSYVTGIMDRVWWHENLGQCPPLLWGAGSGLSPVASAIALMKKSA